MLKSARKILIVALLLVLPLQAAAASISHLACSASAANAQGNDGHHHEASGEDNAPDHKNMDTGDGHVDNLPCFQQATGGSYVAIAIVVEFGSGFGPTESSVPGHFFPEQPQRVPLA